MCSRFGGDRRRLKTTKRAADCLRVFQYQSAGATDTYARWVDTGGLLSSIRGPMAVA